MKKKYYWKGLEQISNDPDFIKNAEKEFSEYLPVNRNENGGSSRRDFLKMMGFSIAAASLAACEAPVRKAIPYVTQPVDISPGVPNYYASSYVHKGDYCSIVVKTREGRPIKIEGNELSGVTQGGVSAQVEASVLNLYDKQRITDPYAAKRKISWQELDAEVSNRLRTIAGRGGQIRIVSPSILSPSAKSAIQRFLSTWTTARHVVYDAGSVYGMREANRINFGLDAIPSYDFSKADAIVGISADFLGSWISPIEHIKQYSKTRKLGKGKTTMSRHYQFEPLMTLTGANADYRSPIKPSQEGLAVVGLYNLIAQRAGAAQITASNSMDIPLLEKAAGDLWKSRGKALVVCGSNNPFIQQTVNNINALLGAYGSGLIDVNTPVNYRQGDDEQMQQFVYELAAGNIDAVIFYGANPVYDHPSGKDIAAGIAKANLSVSTSERMDETTDLVGFIAPDHNFLESWSDSEPKRGYYSLIQPAITPLFNSRQAEESLLRWSGAAIEDYYTYLLDYWRSNIFPLQSEYPIFEDFWQNTLYKGVFELPPQQRGGMPAFNINLGEVGNAIMASARAVEGWELVLYEKPGSRTGSMANNPWLQEMPDPISKVCWGNYVSIPQNIASEWNVKFSEGMTSLARVTIGDQSFEIPIVVQPGQAKRTIGIALGYGRRKAGPVADGLGIDVFPFVRYENNTLVFNHLDGVNIEPTGKSFKLAQTQTHHTYMGRETVIQEALLSDYQEDPMAGRYAPTLHTSEGVKNVEEISLWHEHQYNNHHWGMIIDLNSCVGCAACVVACQVENNVPVVGKDEVLNRREMHWLRIDRYYSSDAEADDYSGLEKAAENPEVTFQPMLCQQCNNAPCETVCPVAATTHSTEGLNQMAYNRCIGTRYCANNCPYKVRRFNWFKYHNNEKFMDVNFAMYDDLGKMVLNPDVTVRSRGVMEKCTFCVQRIQLGKLEARKERRRVRDGEIVTACAKACPADAIMFGDMNDMESNIAKYLGFEPEEGKIRLKVNEPRAYNVLAELNTRSNIYYLTKIRNKDKA